MTDRPARIRALFEQALARTDPLERSRWLRQVAAEDPAVADVVEALLAADADPLTVLDATPADLVDAVRPPQERSRDGERVGPYRLIREIGRGGMGAVYLAEREDVELRVALKLLRAGAGLASPDHVRRFLLERRLLARLQHPNIARLLDGGVTPDGTHWLAMELVEGEPITAFCDRLRLGIRARLRLLEAVCEAVGYAHQNLVVHRDLKPDNILVLDTGTGRWPKLLDFGIAKLLEEGDAGGRDDVATRTGVRPLTPAYAAPEQLEGGSVTTVTDVYALGVILYELLTGRRPAPATPGGDDPVRPSVAVARRRDRAVSEADPVSPAVLRGVAPDRLPRVLAGDLDNIAMKALERDPARRYPTAVALADDLRRYREGRTVTARPPTSAYRARKFLARNRVGVSVAALVLLSLVTGLGTALWQATEAGRARHRAERALAESEQVRTFLADLFRARDPHDVRPTAITLTDLLAQGLVDAARLEDQPLVQARVLEEIGRVYYDRGEFERAESVFRRVLERREGVLGPAAPATARALVHLGDAVRRDLRFDEAERLYRRALAIRSATVGERHPDYAAVLVGLASLATFRGQLDQALSLYEMILDTRRQAFGPEHPSVAEALRLVAVTERRRGDYPRATAMYQAALELRRRIHGPASPEAGWAMVHLADQLAMHNGDPAAAEPLYEDGLRILRDRLGNGHPDLLHALHSLATLRERAGEFDVAEAHRRESLDIVRRYYGEENWRYATEVDMLGTHFRRRGDHARSEEMHLRALALFERLYPPTHRNPISSRSNLAETYLASGDHRQAEAVVREALALREEAEGPDSPLAARERERLGQALLLQGRLDEAEAEFRRALAILREQRAPAHLAIQRLLGHLAAVQEARQAAVPGERGGLGFAGRSGFLCDGAQEPLKGRFALAPGPAVQAAIAGQTQGPAEQRAHDSRAGDQRRGADAEPAGDGAARRSAARGSARGGRAGETAAHGEVELAPEERSEQPQPCGLPFRSGRDQHDPDVGEVQLTVEARPQAGAVGAVDEDAVPRGVRADAVLGQHLERRRPDHRPERLQNPLGRGLNQARDLDGVGLIDDPADPSRDPPVAADRLGVREPALGDGHDHVLATDARSVRRFRDLLEREVRIGNGRHAAPTSRLMVAFRRLLKLRRASPQRLRLLRFEPGFAIH